MEMTRRQFLERMARVGGAAVAYSTMNAWGLFGNVSAGRPPQLVGRADGAELIILGAGIAGLVTAYEMSKRGYNCRILEARDRVGGIVSTVRRGDVWTEVDGEPQTCQFDEGMYFNPGPWRIPHHHTGLLGYCHELGVSLEVFVNENYNGYVYREGVDGPLSNTRVRLREIQADMRGYTAELLAKAVRQDELDLALTQDDKERLVAYLVHEGYLDNESAAYRGTGNRGMSGPRGLSVGVPTDPYDLAALLQSGLGQHFRSVASYDMQGTMFQPVGGMDQIPRAFERVLGDHITYMAEALEIRQSADGVRVVYRDRRNGDTHEVTGDYCVSAMPLSVLQSVEADFSPDMQAAVDAVSYGASGKIGLQMKRRFWEQDDQIYGGHSYHNLPLGGTISYPNNDYGTAKGIVLGFYTGGSTGISVGEMSLSERIEYALEHGSKVHPQYREEFETGFSVFWSRVPYSLGSTASWSASARAAHYDRLLEPDGRIFVATGGVSQQTGWQEGAVASAWNTVENLHEMAMRQASAGSYAVG